MLVPVPAMASGGAAVAGGILLFVACLFGTAAYFVPTIIAFARKKSNKIAILVLNLFLGWSLIGWVISLVWALSNDQQAIIVQQTFHGQAPVSTDIRES